MHSESIRRKPNELLQTATEAAGRGDPIEMIEALMASGLLDGLVRRLERQWPDMQTGEIDDCVALAIESAFTAVLAGKTIRNLGGWLFKVSQNAAQDRWKAHYSERVWDEEAVERLVAQDKEDDGIREEREALDDYRMAEAVRLARELLPRIGEGQIISVMELVIDAVEQGLPEFPASEIAETLGISEGSARKLLSRGFERLTREAERAGYELPACLPETLADKNGENKWLN